MRWRTTSAAVAAAMLSAGCGGGSAGEAAGAGTVTVFAASSLTDAFNDAGSRFRTESGDTARFSFAGSQDLATQIAEGAPADVLATADVTTMDKVRDELDGPPHVLARNKLVIVTAKDNPHHVESLADLDDPSLVVVLADPSVPAGSYAAQALAAAHVEVSPKSLEPEVRSVLTKVAVGEADAGIVYATDAESAADEVTAVPIDNAPVATYEIAPVTNAGREFVAFMLSPPGQTALERYGFLPP